MRTFALAAIALLAPIALQARPAPNVRIATAEQKAGCKYLGIVSAVNYAGRNLPAGALKGAMRKVEKAGGNALYAVTSSQNDESASVNGEAYSCPAGTF